MSAKAIRVSSRRTITSSCFNRPEARRLRLRRKVSGRSCALVMLITAHSASRACSRPCWIKSGGWLMGRSIARVGYGLDKVGERGVVGNVALCQLKLAVKA